MLKYCQFTNCFDLLELETTSSIIFHSLDHLTTDMVRGFELVGYKQVEASTNSANIQTSYDLLVPV